MSWFLAHVSWIWEFALPFGVVLGVVVLFVVGSDLWVRRRAARRLSAGEAPEETPHA